MIVFNPLPTQRLFNNLLKEYIHNLEYAVVFKFEGKCKRNLELNLYTIAVYKDDVWKETFIYCGDSANINYTSDVNIISNL